MKYPTPVDFMGFEINKEGIKIFYFLLYILNLIFPFIESNPIIEYIEIAFFFFIFSI